MCKDLILHSQVRRLALKEPDPYIAFAYILL